MRRSRSGRGLLRLLTVGRLAIRLGLSSIVGYILPLEDQLDRRTELLVVGVTHNLPNANILAHVPASAGKMELGISLGVHREPILAIHLLAVRGKGRGKILMSLAHIVGNILRAGNHNLHVLLVHPDASL